MAAAGPSRLRWPTSRSRQPDPALVTEDTVTLPVQLNGKVRFTIEVPAARQPGRDHRATGPPSRLPKHEVARIVIVPGKIVSIVLR